MQNILELINKTIDSTKENLSTLEQIKLLVQGEIKKERELPAIISQDGISIEVRELSTGGLKPPNKWNSYAEMDSLEKSRLKEELLKNSHVAIEHKDSNFISASDVFGYLEDFDGDLIIDVMSNEKDIERSGVVLSGLLEKIQNLDVVALNIFDPISGDKFVAVIDFDKMSGVLKFRDLLDKNNSRYNLDSIQKREFSDFLTKNSIEQ